MPRVSKSFTRCAPLTSSTGPSWSRGSRCIAGCWHIFHARSRRFSISRILSRGRFVRIVRAMPVLSTSSYHSPGWLRNAHVQTVWPTLCRRVKDRSFAREKLATPDGDFLILDWLRGPEPAPRLAILSHGLEGNSRRQYMAGMARALHARGFDVLAWNYRGCGGELNDASRFYHSGDTGDLRTI